MAMASLALLASACGGERRDAMGLESGIDVDGSGSTTSAGSSHVDSGVRLDVRPPGAGESEANLEGTGDCSADLAGTMLQPIYLGFAFDVSGSMGKLDYPWHDPALKWEPVVAATKAFFADDTSSGIAASLSFFPAEDDRCDAESYAPPDVAMTPLPSDVFADAIDDVTPETSDDWRGGTPTLAVTQATLAMLDGLAGADPTGRYVFVLVSDGYPQGCDDDDDAIEATVEAVAEVSDRVLTYVVGVANPPGGPDTVTNLDQIAVAGGSGQAFIVETGNAGQTAVDFKAAIEAIRSDVASCSLVIPESPDGQPLEPDRVNVTYDMMPLGYDPDCVTSAGWRYDDPDAPTRIELCPGVCEDVRAEPGREVTIEFGCETRPAIP